MSVIRTVSIPEDMWEKIKGKMSCSELMRLGFRAKDELWETKVAKSAQYKQQIAELEERIKELDERQALEKELLSNSRQILGLMKSGDKN